MNSSFIAKKLQEYFDTLSTKNVRFITYVSPSTAGNVVQLSTQCNISEYDIVRESDPADLYFKALNDIKNELLKTELFEDVKKDLKHYEELKNMKFVLDSLDKLDIIKQSKPKLGIDKLSDL